MMAGLSAKVTLEPFTSCVALNYLCVEPTDVQFGAQMDRDSFLVHFHGCCHCRVHPFHGDHRTNAFNGTGDCYALATVAIISVARSINKRK